MQSHNLAKCNLCSVALIAEEMSSHICFAPTQVWVIDGIVYLSDGKRLYQDLSDESKQVDYAEWLRRRGNITCKTKEDVSSSMRREG